MGRNRLGVKRKVRKEKDLITLDRAWAGLQQEAEWDKVIKVVEWKGTHPLRQGWGQKPVLLLFPGQGVLWACCFSREDALMD